MTPTPMYNLLILVSYFLIGASIKYIDQAYDYKVFNKKLATLLSVPSAALIGYLMVTDSYSASIFLAVSLGVAVANKIDNIAFRIGIALVVLVPLLFNDIITIHWVPFGALFLAGAADEFGNDWSDRHQKEKLKSKLRKQEYNESPLQNSLSFFFGYRGLMKAMALALVLVGQMPPIYFIAFLLFDIGYTVVEKISFQMKPYRLKNPTQSEKQKKKPYREPKNQTEKQPTPEPITQPETDE